MPVEKPAKSPLPKRVLERGPRSTRTPSRWSLIVDTNQYTGSFDDEFTAFVTGEARNGGRVPEDDVARWNRSVRRAGVRDLFEHRPHDFGDDLVARVPSRICPTPGWSMEPVRTYDPHQRPRWYRVTRARPMQIPAYLSLEIFLRRRPNRTEIAVLKRRAAAWKLPDYIAEYLGEESVKIQGWRLVEEGVLSERDV